MTHDTCFVFRDAGLTIGQSFDTMWVRALDKILQKNKINRLSLKSVGIRGKTVLQAVSGMVLETAVKALGV